jgi:2'-5' RNA ligase
VARERLKSPRARLFVALDLPPAVRDEIVAWQREALRDPALRPVPPESLHMTLVFLGYHSEKEIDRIATTSFGGPPGELEPPPAPEVEIAPEPVGVPRGRRPRLFALDAPSEGAVALQAEVEERLAAERLYKPEKRPFWPHLTVARVKPEKRGSRKPAMVEEPPGPLRTGVRFRPTRLVVFRSHLKPSGAEYEPVAELELPTAGTRER